MRTLDLTLHGEKARPNRLPGKRGAHVRYAPAEKCKTCGESTKHGKPYCEDHIENMPLVAGILRDLAKINDEIAALRAGRSPHPDWLLVQEAKVLAQTTREVVRIARNFPVEVSFEETFRLLRAAGVKTHATSRRKGGRGWEVVSVPA